MKNIFATMLAGMIIALAIYIISIFVLPERKFSDNFIKINFLRDVDNDVMKKFFFSNNKEKCIFNFNESGKSNTYTINLAKDVEYINNDCSERRHCIKTTDNRYFAIQHDGEYADTQYTKYIVDGYFKHCLNFK